MGWKKHGYSVVGSVATLALVLFARDARTQIRADSHLAPVVVALPIQADAAVRRVAGTMVRDLKGMGLGNVVAVELGDDTPAQIEAMARAHLAGLVVVLDGAGSDLEGDAFAIEVEELGAWPGPLGRGATVVRLGGTTALADQYAAYELMRRLGVRYFHPEHEYLPRIDPASVRERARTPTALARARDDGTVESVYRPDYLHRSFSFHGAHPLAVAESFSDGDHPIEEALRVHDWIVKNRGDLTKGGMRGVAGEERRQRRLAELEANRKELGLRRMVGITLHNLQQGANAAIDPDADAASARAQVEAEIVRKLAEAPDTVAFGVQYGASEVSVTPDRETVAIVDHVGEVVQRVRPDLAVLVNSHITGAQPTEHFGDLGCPTGTNTEGRSDYYDLAFHTRPDLGVRVHTVMFYPLEGPARVYNQRTFAHKLCLMKNASAQGRPLWYFPEGSWWLGFDNSVPVYLPLYLWARKRDIDLLAPLLRTRGGGTLEGHRMFDSGHEWGYWQQDYAVGMWHFNVDVPLDAVLAEIADPTCPADRFGDGCPARDEVVAVLGEVIEHQREMFLERRDFRGRPGGLYAYFAGEEAVDVAAAGTGMEFRPVRVAFEAVASLTESEREALDADLDQLRRAASAYRRWAERLNAIRATVPPGGLPWLDEIRDGLEINGLRARQAVELYGVVLELRIQRAQGASPEAIVAGAAEPLRQAKETLDRARAVVRRREAGYRYAPDKLYGGGTDSDTGVPNGTTYPFRVHTKTHLMTYWTNRHDEVRALVDRVAGDLAGRVRVEPVFAAPGVPLNVRWAGAPGELLDLDGPTPRPAALDPEPGLHPVRAIPAGSTDPIQGTIVRTEHRGRTPRGGVTLSEPSAPVAQSVIGNLMPAFMWALAPGPGGGLAFGILPRDDQEPAFHGVVVAPVARGGEHFRTDPIGFALPLVNRGGSKVLATLKVEDAVFTGPSALGDSLNIEGRLVLRPIVEALIDLAGFDETGAVRMLAGILKFDPVDPPSSVPFSATLQLQGPG